MGHFMRNKSFSKKYRVYFLSHFSRLGNEPGCIFTPHHPPSSGRRCPHKSFRCLACACVCAHACLKNTTSYYPGSAINCYPLRKCLKQLSVVSSKPGPSTLLKRRNVFCESEILRVGVILCSWQPSLPALLPCHPGLCPLKQLTREPWSWGLQPPGLNHLHVSMSTSTFSIGSWRDDITLLWTGIIPRRLKGIILANCSLFATRSLLGLSPNGDTFQLFSPPLV